MSACPTEATLQRLASGTLAEMTFAHVEEHVECCESCQNFLQVLVRNDLELPRGNLSSGDPVLPSVSGFILERELGRGRNGVVYLARETALDRPVALKFLAEGEERRPQSHATRVSEAHAISRLRHPQIVRIHQVVDLRSQTVLVLEYVPGGTLADGLTTPFSPQLAAGILEAVARTIAFIHKLGFLHLDIKPSNILIEGEPGCRAAPSNVMISDFGIALPFDEATEAAPGCFAPLGTPAYMSPEQTGRTGAPLGPTADIYALGALLYHLLTGRPPFRGSAADIVEMVNTLEPDSPRSLNPKISLDLEAVCLHCLKKSPGQRYASADALADDLRRFLDDRPVSVRSATAMDQVRAWYRRRPAVAALTTALTVTIVGSLIGSLLLLAQSESNRERAEFARRHAEENAAVTSRSLAGLGEWTHLVLKDPTLLTEYQLRGANIDVDHGLIPDPRYAADGLPADDESLVRMFVTVNQLQRDLALKLSNQPEKLSEAGLRFAKLRTQMEDCRRRWPQAEVLREEAVLTLIDSAEGMIQQDELDKAAGYLTQTAGLAAALRDDAFRISVYADISLMRRRMAYFMNSMGHADTADDLLHSDLRMLEAVSTPDALMPDVRYCKAQALSQLGRRHETIPMLRDLTALDPSQWSRPNDSRDRFYEWIRTPVVVSLLEPGVAAAGDELDEGHQADALIETLSQQAREIGIRNPDVPAIAITVSHGVQIACSAKRRLKQIDSARNVVRRFVVFADHLVALYPDRADAHIVVSDAYLQVAKNAWQRGDDREGVDHLQKAYAAAQHAAEIDPQSLDAQHLAARLEAKLRKTEKDLIESADQ